MIERNPDSLDSKLPSDEFYTRAYRAPVEEKPRGEQGISYLRTALAGFLGLPSLTLTTAFICNDETELLSGIAERPVTSLAFPVIGAIMCVGIRYLVDSADKEDNQ